MAVLVAILWGVSPVLCKGLLSHMPVPQLVVIVSTVSAIAAWIYWGLRGFRGYKPLKSSVVVTALAVGVAGFCAANLLYFEAISRTHSFVVVSLVQVSVVISLIMGYLLLRERPTPGQVLGVVLVFIGCVLVASSRLRR
jgi:drug/metabolite transporter (DMT)-like permease